jgi:dinuclear metal center YbgI/SA1388 family protein
MYKYEITKRIEDFAPPETQEDWDCSGWAVNIDGYDKIGKVMLCLTVTKDIIRQAKEQNCDMIVSHHPCFYVPLEWSFINIYCAHTNMDKAKGGTTDTVIDKLGLSEYKTEIEHDFLRVLDYKTTLNDFSKLIKQIFPNARLINPHPNPIPNGEGVTPCLNKIAFCAGSGSDLINDAKELGVDCFVTGDLKFHRALESPIIIYDIGHFESEILILPIFGKIIGNDVKIVYADEHSPFEMI